VPALAHRITLRPEMWLRRIDPSFVVTEVLGKTPAPASGALPSYGGPAGTPPSPSPPPSPPSPSPRARAAQ